MNNPSWNRIVIKVGSALIAPERNGCSSHYLLSIASFIVRCRQQGTQVVLVSSGSVAAGAHLFEETQGSAISDKKAMAAAGQTEMMATWDRLFDFSSAQILLTHADLRDRERFLSIRETMDSLLDNDILPIVNENDTITTDRLKVGDNDNLSAMVAAAANADALIICSDIDGLFDSNPQLNPDALLISEVNEITEQIYAMAGGATSAVGTGGMKTKIQAAEKAVSQGISTYIINGFKQESFDALLQGKNPGTVFHPHETPLQESKHWVRHTTKALGEIVVDDEFSLSPERGVDYLSSSDLIGVVGEFAVGDVVLLRTGSGEKLAKAKTNYSSCLLDFVTKQDDDALNQQIDRTPKPILSDKFSAMMETQ
ncbi:glutamate 5-kinase [Thalassotalea mangrovi]|uniref:Glutamate 5-kinase n=1 Tax=Thalassotalea mangrovi TaxID=2572245 RepID=A0A4U1BBA7_9GAMM|nr:glutamate 5-kinase [Thalassotalea mangrovi]TKB47707.1 glutamate 5-kinase [Thalassotalea mangrovi]